MAGHAKSYDKPRRRAAAVKILATREVELLDNLSDALPIGLEEGGELLLKRIGLLG